MMAGNGERCDVAADTAVLAAGSGFELAAVFFAIHRHIPSYRVDMGGYFCSALSAAASAQAWLRYIVI